MKQINIFGDEIEIEETKEPVKRLTMKEKFRLEHGYKNGYKCKNCKFFVRGRYHGKYYQKCEKLGITHSEATDIRQKDIACNLFEVS